VAALIATTAIFQAAPALAATPVNRVFGGVINRTQSVTDPCGNRHNEGEGYLRVALINGKKKVVPPRNFQACQGTGYWAKILAPNAGPVGGAPFPVCDPYNANLDVTSIPISGGAFDWTGYTFRTTATVPRYHVHFKGSWSSPTQVKGFTQITKGTCNTGKMYWTMNVVRTS
jgi:hypothetical protein